MSVHAVQLFLMGTAASVLQSTSPITYMALFQMPLMRTHMARSVQCQVCTAPNLVQLSMLFESSYCRGGPIYAVAFTCMYGMQIGT